MIAALGKRMLDGDEYESLCCQCSEYQHQHAWGLWFAVTRTILARQSPAVLVYRTKDKGTRRVQGYVCAVRENGQPMRTKPTPTTYTHGDWSRHVAVIDGAARTGQSPAVYVIVKLLSLHTTMFEAVYSCVLPLGILKGCNQVAVVSGFFRF
jgi:hypothetical protein